MGANYQCDLAIQTYTSGLTDAFWCNVGDGLVQNLVCLCVMRVITVSHHVN
jgi:hypothetical protein